MLKTEFPVSAKGLPMSPHEASIPMNRFVLGFDKIRLSGEVTSGYLNSPHLQIVEFMLDY